jgi:kumamolisin
MPRQHVELPGSHRPIKSDAKRLRDADPQSHVEVTVELRRPELPDHLPAKPLNEDSYAEQYGSAKEDADRVSEVLTRFGLKIEEVSLPTWSMRVSGTVAAMEAAFQPRLGVYHSREQGEFRGREGSLKLPIELAGIVTGVFGLDERRVARRRSDTATAMPLAPLGPADLATRYHFPQGDGSHQTIAIAEFGGGYFGDDLSAYSTKFQLGSPSVTVQPVNLTPLTLEQMKQLPKQEMDDEVGATEEVMMDVQVVAGLCPKANIIVYFATFDQKGWVDLLNQVVLGKPAKPVTLSVSWGAPEDSGDWSASALNAINSRLNAVAMLGVTVCVSSGDDGSGDGVGDNRVHVDFPASSPFVLGVGGTMITGTSAKMTESAWWVSPGQRNGKGAGATGGGVSAVFPRPKWQNVQVRSLNSRSIDGRVVPDVSALSGPPLYDLIFLGNPAPNGGTSASTPLWAALIARINGKLPAEKQQRFLTPLLYQNGANAKPVAASACTDITAGQNASHPTPGVGYQAGPGFDAVTGWGTPNGQALLNAL